MNVRLVHKKIGGDPDRDDMVMVKEKRPDSFCSGGLAWEEYLSTKIWIDDGELRTLTNTVRHDPVHDQ